MSKIPSNWRAVRYEQRFDSSGFSWMVVGDADDEAGALVRWFDGSSGLQVETLSDLTPIPGDEP